MKSFPPDYPKIYSTVKNGKIAWFVNAKHALYPIGKKKWCKSEKEALQYKQDILDTIKNVQVDLRDTFIVKECERVIKAYGIDLTIQEIVNKFCREFNKQIPTSLKQDITLIEAHNEFLNYKKSGDRILSKETLNELRIIPLSFIKFINGKSIVKFVNKETGVVSVKTTFQKVTDEQIKAYLGTFENMQTRSNKRRVLNSWFAWGVYAKYLKENPVKFIKKPHVQFVEPNILSLEKVILLLKTIKENDIELMPYFALGLFIGLRPKEALRLESKDFDFESRTIKVPYDKTKTRRSRLITVRGSIFEDAFYSFMPEFKPINLKNFRRRFDNIRIKVGYKLRDKNPDGREWEDDVLRHTFASNFLSINESKATLANIMNNSEYIIAKHYQFPVKKENGEKYFALRIDNLDEKPPETT